MIQIKDRVVALMKNKRLMRYFVMAVIIVGIELVTFQVIYVISTNYFLGTIISFIVGVTLNWTAGRIFIFGSSIHHPIREFTMVLIASLVGLAIQIGVIFVSVQLLLLYPLVGKILSILFSFFWNYWFRAKIVYKQN